MLALLKFPLTIQFGEHPDATRDWKRFNEQPERWNIVGSVRPDNSPRSRSRGSSKLPSEHIDRNHLPEIKDLVGGDLAG